MKKVSFAIIVRNGEKTIRNCLDSITRVPYKEKEVLVIDDNSSDATLNVVREYSVKIIKKSATNRGIATSRNIALQNARGDFVFVIDGDIELKKIDIEGVIKFFRNNPMVIALSGYYSSKASNKWNFNDLLDRRREFIYLKMKKEFIYDLSNYTTFSGGFCCINKSKLKEIPKFRKNLSYSGEDLIWQISLIKMGYKFAFYPDLEGIHTHPRGMQNALNKTISESKGDIWVIMETSQLKGFPPILENVLYFPFLIAIGFVVILKNPLLSILILLFELLPYLYICIFVKNFSIRNRIAFLVYSILNKFLFYYYIMVSLLFKKYSFKTKLKVIIYCLYSDPIAKIKWIINMRKLFFS